MNDESCSADKSIRNIASASRRPLGQAPIRLDFWSSCLQSWGSGGCQWSGSEIAESDIRDNSIVAEGWFPDVLDFQMILLKKLVLVHSHSEILCGAALRFFVLEKHDLLETCFVATNFKRNLICYSLEEPLTNRDPDPYRILVGNPNP